MIEYLIDKYAVKQDFGGMIGFLLKGDIEEIKEKIKKALEELKDKIGFGNLEDFKDKSIEENTFTFESIHIRKNGEQITLHHIIFDFTAKEGK